MEKRNDIHINDRPTIFFDRDGTLIKEKHYLSDPNQVELEAGVIEGLTLLKEYGCQFVIITNQSGIGRGYFSESDYRRVQDALYQQLDAYQLSFLGDYFCPHHPTKGQGKYAMDCDCRKPGTKLIDMACHDHGIHSQHGFMVGDKWSDLLAGIRAGLLPVHVQTGHDSEQMVQASFHAYSEDNAHSADLPKSPLFSGATFLDVAHHILKTLRKIRGT